MQQNILSVKTTCIGAELITCFYEIIFGQSSFQIVKQIHVSCLITGPTQRENAVASTSTKALARGNSNLQKTDCVYPAST